MKIEGIQSFQDNTVYNFQLSDGAKDEGLSAYTGFSRIITISLYKSNNTICDFLNNFTLKGRVFQFQDGIELIDVVFTNKSKSEVNGVEIITISLGGV